MRYLFALVAFILVLAGTPPTAVADDMLIDDFQSEPQPRWRFFSDTVMGGVSTGQVQILSEDGQRFARMTGDVSTENNGGFIQMRIDLPSAAPEGATGVRLIVRGNDQRYFVHLRSGGTVLPWQYYQAGFDVSGGMGRSTASLHGVQAIWTALAPGAPRAGADIAWCRGLWARSSGADRCARSRVLLSRLFRQTLFRGGQPLSG